MLLIDVVREPAFMAGKAPGTLENYRGVVREVARDAVTDSGDLTVGRMGAFVARRLQEVRPATVRKDVTLLCGLLGYLERTERFAVADLRRLARLAPRAEPRDSLCADHLSRDEWNLLLASAHSVVARWTITMATLTGLRAGELRRLDWSDVDLKRRLIHVRSTPAEPTKTRRSRVVPIVEELLPHLLAEHRGQTHGTVVGRDGRRVSHRTIYKRVTRAGRRAGHECTLLLLRHTRASWWVQAGVPMAKVAKWLGHSVAVCEKFYAGLRDTFDPDADRVA